MPATTCPACSSDVRPNADGSLPRHRSKTGVCSARACCPSCRTMVGVTRDGNLRRHHRDGEVCPGDAALIPTVAMPWSKALTQNQVRRMHHLVEAKVKRQMSDDARWLIRAAKLAPVERAHITLHYRPGTRRPCDADGIAPTLKVALDALVREGVLPDDDWRHVPAVTMRIHPPADGMPASFWLEIGAPE